MVKVSTAAAGTGILAGLLGVGTLFYGTSPLHSFWSTMVLITGLVLILDSLVALVGPKRIFYVSALLSVLLGGSEWFGSGSDATTATFVTVAMAGIALVLSMVAARLEPKVSEQSNPMNLPVFG